MRRCEIYRLTTAIKNPYGSRAPGSDWRTLDRVEPGLYVRTLYRAGIEGVGEIQSSNWSRPGFDFLTQTVRGDHCLGALIAEHAEPVTLDDLTPLERLDIETHTSSVDPARILREMVQRGNVTVSTLETAIERVVGGS